MKKGLGRIPKSLSWLEEPVETPKPKPQPKHEAIAPARKEEAHQPNAKPTVDNLSTVEDAPKSSQQGLPHGWTRATFIISKELNEKIKALAYWDRLTVKEVMHDALNSYLSNRNVKPMPRKKGL